MKRFNQNISANSKYSFSQRLNFTINFTSDWTLQADLDKKLQIPDIVQTSLRPDIVIQSIATKRHVIVELTVPWEERCQRAYELKKSKYIDLQTLCKERGWQTWLFPAEVCCRGFPAQSMWTTLSSLCIVRRQRRATVKALGQAAERASSWLWLKRDQENWKLSNEG